MSQFAPRIARCLAAWCCRLALLSGAALAVTAAPAAAQYPARTVRIVVPYTPGGAADVTTRIVAEKLSKKLGQPFIIENKPGAGSLIGSEAVAKAAPDGYTLLWAGQTLIIPVASGRKVGFDVMGELTPIATIGVLPLVIVVHPSVPAKTIAELIAYAKSHPGQLNCATNGIGTTVHFALETFKLMSGVDITNVAYKGGGPQTLAVMSGEVQMSLDGIAGPLAQVKAGKVRPLGVSTAARSAIMPDVPTIAETLPGYEMVSWMGILAPAGTPKEIVATLSAAIAQAMQEPDVREKFLAMGLEPTSVGPAAFRTIMDEDIAKTAKLIKDAKLVLD